LEVVEVEDDEVGVLVEFPHAVKAPNAAIRDNLVKVANNISALAFLLTLDLLVVFRLISS